VFFNPDCRPSSQRGLREARRRGQRCWAWQESPLRRGRRGRPVRV